MIDEIKIEKAPDKSYRLSYISTKNFKTICNMDGVCFEDKSKIRKILLSVIKNFNENNPNFTIEVKS